jgi:hypothetical protein
MGASNTLRQVHPTYKHKPLTLPNLQKAQTTALIVSVSGVPMLRKQLCVFDNTTDDIADILFG